VIVVGAYAIGHYRNQQSRSAPDVTAQTPEPAFVGFEPSEIDLGTQLWDTPVHFDATFFNLGDGAVGVERVRASCDCIVIDADALAGQGVPPGEVLDISGTLDTGKHPGALLRTITIDGESGQSWTAQLHVNVEGTWSLSADHLEFGTAELGMPHEQLLERPLTFRSAKDELVGEPECDAPWVTCFPARRDPETTEILVRIAQDQLTPGVNTADVVLRTTSRVRPDVAVHVRVTALQALVARPGSVFLVGLDARDVRVFDRAGRAINLVAAESSHDQLEARIVPPNALRIRNTSGRPLVEPACVKVVEDEGRSLNIRVSTF